MRVLLLYTKHMENEVVYTNEKNSYLIFYCPGCKEGHTIKIAGNDPWTWDGNKVKPTISPSVLLWLEHHPDEDEEEKKYVNSRRCHSFIRNGMIEFLGDCGHAFAGQTVPLHPIPADYGVQ